MQCVCVVDYFFSGIENVTWLILNPLLGFVQGLQNALCQVLVLPDHSVAVPDIHHFLLCKHIRTMNENLRMHRQGVSLCLFS